MRDDFDEILTRSQTGRDLSTVVWRLYNDQQIVTSIDDDLDDDDGGASVREPRRPKPPAAPASAMRVGLPSQF